MEATDTLAEVISNPVVFSIRHLPEWIQTFGFPVIVCLLLIFVIYNIVNRNTEERQEEAQLNREFAIQQAQLHRDERQEWIQQAQVAHRLTLDAIHSLEDAIRRHHI